MRIARRPPALALTDRIGSHSMVLRSIKPTKRTRASRETKPILFIFCEGTKTEPLYFNSWRTRGMSMQIIPVSHTDPVGIVRDARRLLENYDFEPRAGDSVWCVYDVDENEDTALGSAFKFAASKKFNVVVSNPCFELWYLLHFQAIFPPTNGANISQMFKKYIPDYQKNNPVYSLLKPHVAMAIENAKLLAKKYDSHVNPKCSRAAAPYTSVYELIETILDAQARAERLKKQ